MRLLKIEDVSRFLLGNSIEHSVYGKVKQLNIDEDSIDEILGYSYKNSNIGTDVKLLFSDQLNDDVDTCFICENPKYVLYFVIFEFFFNDLKEPIYVTLERCNSITDKVVIGDSVKTGGGNQIGGEPFSFYRIGEEQHQVKALAGVQICENVVIANGNVIDSGIFSDTVIGSNSVLDSNCYIAHDVKIGSNCTITSGVSIGGFTQILENCIIGMNSTIRNNVRIGSNTKIGMGSVVTKSFGNNLTIYGNPARIRFYHCSCGSKIHVNNEDSLLCQNCLTKYRLEDYDYKKLERE